MGKRNTEFERSYKTHSVTYDQKRFKGKANAYLEFIRTDAFSALLPKKKGAKVLDVGCGTGRGSFLMAKKGFCVTGIDLTEEMLDIAKQKQQRLGLTNVDFRQGSARKLPFEDASFDCVTALNFLHMFGLIPQKAMIDEMVRVLKPCGTLIVEFDSYYKAVVMGAVVQKQKPRTHFNRPGDLHYLFDRNKVKIERVYGAVIPFLWRVFMHIPRAAVYCERCSRLFPFNYLAERFYVKAVKCL